MGPLVFWLGNLMWDYVNYLLPSLLLLVVFAAYGTEAYVEGGRLGVVALVLALYGWAILPFVYLAHFLFSSPPTGMVVIIVFNIFSGEREKSTQTGTRTPELRNIFCKDCSLGSVKKNLRTSPCSRY